MSWRLCNDIIQDLCSDDCIATIQSVTVVVTAMTVLCNCCGDPLDNLQYF